EVEREHEDHNAQADQMDPPIHPSAARPRRRPSGAPELQPHRGLVDASRSSAAGTSRSSLITASGLTRAVARPPGGNLITALPAAPGPSPSPMGAAPPRAGARRAPPD